MVYIIYEQLVTWLYGPYSKGNDYLKLFSIKAVRYLTSRKILAFAISYHQKFDHM